MLPHLAWDRFVTAFLAMTHRLPKLTDPATSQKVFSTPANHSRPSPGK